MDFRLVLLVAAAACLPSAAWSGRRQDEAGNNLWTEADLERWPRDSENNFAFWENLSRRWQMVRVVQLYCRTGYHLQVFPDGAINGTRQDESPWGIMEIRPAGLGSVVSIKAVFSGRYLGMNSKGDLYAADKIGEETAFTEWTDKAGYKVYESILYGHSGPEARKFCVALNKNGKPRNGRRTKRSRASAQFVPRNMGESSRLPTNRAMRLVRYRKKQKKQRRRNRRKQKRPSRQ
ncbi:PREDICTED: fibroblast growth factor 16-like [Branchiostoma belcheri]|uniref:Fibroblast growth factor n=1 Tax=Branchiostoma belcheri TaxID=7741 RepID=A0A6P4Z0T1_BRABE|nr:PREDICTED: fibroblast growth factor 16-like [Branchiostoma belcheri]